MVSLALRLISRILHVDCLCNNEGIARNFGRDLTEGFVMELAIHYTQYCH